MFITKNKELKHIPDNYSDIFELFSSGVMQLNHFKNYKLALLETFVAVEILVVRVTDEIKSSKGISRTKISEFKQAVDLAHRMDIELRLFFKFSQEEEALIGQMVRARKIRNKIMHYNEVAKESEITEIIKSIRSFLFMLIEKHEKI
ncbi:hypothetical protein GCM10009122_56280 [Fulvivirga kasyanovii]|uniref:hypothetical protein n=1 Tax=Fulvivirga kasyanovii TaxID=396812 RepID=UPI0031D3D500